MYKYLNGVSQGSDLTTATCQDGTKLLPADTDSGSAGAIAGSISSVNTNVANNFPPAKSGNTFVAVESPTSLSVHGLKHEVALERLPFQHRLRANKISIESEDFGGWLSDTWDDVTHFAGDVWHGIKDAANAVIDVVNQGVVFLKNGVSFMIGKLEDGFNFLIKIGGQALKIVLNGLASGLKAVTWLLEVIGAALGKVLSWIGHLMGWDKIWETHKIIAAMFTSK